MTQKENQKLLIRNSNHISFTVLLLVLAISNISNSTNNIILAKALIVLTIYLLLVKIGSHNINELYSDLINLKYFYYLILFAAISLFYSKNSDYGFVKIINLIIDVPILLSVSLFTNKLTRKRIISLIFLLSLYSVISLLLILILDPFDQSRLYQFEFTRWSHVIFSRMMSIFYFFILIAFVFEKHKNAQLFYSILLPVMLYQIYYANLRGASFGVVIFTFVILVFAFVKKHLDTKKLLYFSFSLILTVSAIISTPTTDYFDFRYSETFNVLTGKLPKEGGITARLIGYEKALEIIKEKPFLGTGFGGYNGYNDDEFLSLLKYPHNIFLEIQVELGLLGSAFFIFYLITTFRLLYNINIYLLIFWLYTIWLALFAKDISSNLLVFIPLIFYGRPYERERLKEFFTPK